MASIVKFRIGSEEQIVSGQLEQPPPIPVASVSFVIFDEGQEWETVVNFYDTPTDLIREAVEMVVEVVEKAKHEDAGS